MDYKTVLNVIKNVDKIRSCKALQGVSVEQLINGKRFRNNIASYLKEQQETRKTTIASYKAMHKLGGKGINGIYLPYYKLPAHVVDHFIDWTVDNFIAEFINVIAKRSQLSHAERQYIEQLGKQAYNLTVAQYVIEEFPELGNELLPKSNAN